MAKRSAFHNLMTALRRDWRSSLPGVSPARVALGASGGVSVPKANTFYVGGSDALGMHMFVTLYPLRSWVGRFTVEVIFSRQENAPEVWSRVAPDGSGAITEGS